MSLAETGAAKLVSVLFDLLPPCNLMLFTWNVKEALGSLWISLYALTPIRPDSSTNVPLVRY
jgi:hypothetical protein